MISNQIEFLQALIRCKSITPIDDGVIDVIISILEPLGFKCNKLIFSGDGEEEVTNLYAEFGEGSRNLCFAGHTDVVATGDASTWKYDPFSATIEGDKIYGRGAVDMKGAISSFVYAAKRYVEGNPDSSQYNISLLISGNEEGKATNGTPKVIKWLQEKGISIDSCIVGEPTNDNDTIRKIKVGRRGSINFALTVHGKQGHVACPKNCHNPVTDMLNILHLLKNMKLDEGSEFFVPSNLEITTIDVDNSFNNVIPGKIRANFNIRFNDIHTCDSLEELITNNIEKITTSYDLGVYKSGEAFYTENAHLRDLLKKAIEEVEKKEVGFNTSGGTSDARFIKDVCPVVEFGLKNKVAHQVDEHTTIRELENLTSVYYGVINSFFSVPARSNNPQKVSSRQTVFVP